MYITQKQLADRLVGQSNLELRGREGIGRHSTIPHEKKVLIGVLAKTNTQAEVAKAFDTTPQNVSYIARGLSGGKETNPQLKEDIEKVSSSVHKDVSDKAVDILMKSLGVVESKVNREDARSASSIARNMAGIVQQFNPRSDIPQSFSPKIQINIHGSKQKSEEDYDAIDVETVSL
jgi:hypothetical protein